MDDFFRMDLQGDFAEGLDRMAENMKESVSRSGGNGMATVFQEEAKALAPVFRVGPRGGRGSRVARGKIKPGQLRDAIYRAHSNDRSSGAVQLYEVSWNHRKAPHGHWMEYGNARHPAHPFITPAYESAKQRALQTGLQRMATKFAEKSSEPGGAQ